MAAKTAAPLDSTGGREGGAEQTVTSKPVHYDALVVALTVLTFTTGLIDAVSYLGLGRVFADARIQRI